MNITDILAEHEGNGGFSRHYLLLYSVVFGLETRSAFEFGAGFSTRVILEASRPFDGRLITCCPQLPGSTRKTNRCPPEEMQQYGECWTYVQKKSKHAANEIKSRCYDFVLHDGSHTPKVVEQDLRQIIPQMRRRGILLVHDTEHPRFKLKLVMRRVAADFECQRLTLPYGYGLTILRIQQDFGYGEVHPVWKKVKKKRLTR